VIIVLLSLTSVQDLRVNHERRLLGIGLPPVFGPSQTLTMALHDEAQNLY